MATETMVLIGIAVLGVLLIGGTFLPWGKWFSKITDTTSADSLGKRFADVLAELHVEIKKDAALSAVARGAICSTLIFIDESAEQLPSEAQKTSARESLKSLGTIFIVTPDPAAK